MSELLQPHYRLTHPDVFHLLIEGEDSFATRYMSLQADYPPARIFRLRGKKMRSLSDMFDEVGAALQFPYYFGENWAALHDCLLDLDWARADDYLLLICDIQYVLDQEFVDSLESLLDAFVAANVAWSGSSDESDGVSFRVILQCPSEALAISWERLAAANHAQPNL